MWVAMNRAEREKLKRRPRGSLSLLGREIPLEFVAWISGAERGPKLTPEDVVRAAERCGCCCLEWWSDGVAAYVAAPPPDPEPWERVWKWVRQPGGPAFDSSAGHLEQLASRWVDVDPIPGEPTGAHYHRPGS